jgi:pimeloyl-ACP methyl ester carboxylesterase
MPAHQRYYVLRTSRRKESGAWVTPRWWGRFGVAPADMTRDTEALWDLIPSITCPALVVRGEKSNILSPQLAERFASLLQRSQGVQTIVGAGHMITLDQPRRLAQVIDGFLATALEAA